MPEANKVCKAVFCSILLSSCAVAAEDVKKVIDDPAYTHAQRLVEVEPGRRLNLYCLGKGTPTVIFEAGLGGDNSAWARVQPAIAAHTRACSYDRAGIGFSDPARRPSDSANIVDDLHRLLNAAAIKPPYILVGHSLGGMHVRLYADTYFNDVAGMVLVDSAEETWRENWWRLDPKQPSHEQAFALDPKKLEQQRACVKAAEAGFVEGSESYKTCVPPDDPLYSAAINAASDKNQMSVAYQEASASEDNNYQHASADEVIAARRWYGDLPLIVLTSTPTKPRADETQAHRDALNRIHAVFADQLAALSKRGVVRPVPDSTHDIQNTQPQAVIDAILEVLKDAQESQEHVLPTKHS
ncbi:MAG TPA: alpha/beta hydrolase [Xanthomonadaceae bacterium]|nr:alpha/beta hydrolase [Xanthomonadaceae bacterium]